MSLGKIKFFVVFLFICVLSLTNCKQQVVRLSYSYVGEDSLLLLDYNDFPMHINFYENNKFSYKSNYGNYLVTGLKNELNTYNKIALNDFDYVNHKYLGGDTFLVVSMYKQMMHFSLIKDTSTVFSDSFSMIQKFNNDTLVVEFEWLFSSLIFNENENFLFLPVHSYCDWRTKQYFQTPILVKYYLYERKLKFCNVSYPKEFEEKNVGVCSNRFIIQDGSQRLIIGFEGSENFKIYNLQDNTAHEIRQNETGYPKLKNFDLELCENFDLMLDHQNKNYFYGPLFNIKNGMFGRVGLFPLKKTDKGNIGYRELLLYDSNFNLIQKLPLKGNEQFIEYFFWQNKIYAPIIPEKNNSNKVYFNLFKNEN